MEEGYFKKGGHCFKQLQAAVDKNVSPLIWRGWSLWAHSKETIHGLASKDCRGAGCCLSCAAWWELWEENCRTGEDITTTCRYIRTYTIYIYIIEKKMSTCESQSGQKDWKRHYSRALLKELLNLHDLVCLTSNTSHLFAFYFFRLSRWIYWYNNQIDITVFVYINIYV